MAYKRTMWQDHVTEYSDRYTETTNPDGSITHVPVEGTIIQQGTPQNAANFNNMEVGVFESIGLNGLLAMRARLQQDAQIEAEVVAIDTTLTGTTLQTVEIPTAKIRNRTAYNVTAEISSAAGGTVGDIIINTKQANGFKAQYTGTATSVTLRLKVQGGMM